MCFRTDAHEHICEEIREKIFKNYAAKSMREVSNKLVKAALCPTFAGSAPRQSGSLPEVKRAS